MHRNKPPLSQSSLRADASRTRPLRQQSEKTTGEKAVTHTTSLNAQAPGRHGITRG